MKNLLVYIIAFSFLITVRVWATSAALNNSLKEDKEDALVIKLYDIIKF
jgi:uncharacterized membrane protein